MILFVGSNPSNAAKNLVPFTLDTISGRVLFSWIEAAGIVEYTQINLVNATTPDNRPLTKSEIIEAIPNIQRGVAPFTKVVALGKTAVRALTMAEISHLELPHPSGLNRKLNDPEFVKQTIERLREYAAR